MSRQRPEIADLIAHARSLEKVPVGDEPQKPAQTRPMPIYGRRGPYGPVKFGPNASSGNASLRRYWTVV